MCERSPGLHSPRLAAVVRCVAGPCFAPGVQFVCGAGSGAVRSMPAQARSKAHRWVCAVWGCQGCDRQVHVRTSPSPTSDPIAGALPVRWHGGTVGAALQAGRGRRGGQVVGAGNGRRLPSLRCCRQTSGGLCATASRPPPATRVRSGRVACAGSRSASRAAGRLWRSGSKTCDEAAGGRTGVVAHRQCAGGVLREGA